LQDLQSNYQTLSKIFFIETVSNMQLAKTA
jgi:hypothetical protein